MANTSVRQMNADLAQLMEEAEAARLAELPAVIAQVRSLIADYRLKPQDLFAPVKGSGAASTKAKGPARYKDPVSGGTWSGKGRAPQWLVDHESKGGSREDLAVKP